MKHWIRALTAVLIAPLVLSGCLFLPGKFDSTLTINADRSFTFTYKGEVVAADLEGQMGSAFSGLGNAGKTDDAKAEGDESTPEAEETPSAEDAAAKAKEEAEKKAKKEAEYREAAAALAKEAGYKVVEYRGNGIFYVDYAISGTLTHSFVYPYDVDAGMIFPWLSIELRGKDVVRMKAPGFANSDSSTKGMGMGGNMDERMDGTFTLVTDAEALSHNDEDGADSAGGRKTYRWKVTPRTADAPLAVLKVKPLQ